MKIIVYVGLFGVHGIHDVINRVENFWIGVSGSALRVFSVEAPSCEN